MNAVPHSVLTSDGVQALIEALRRRGFHVVGPTVRDRTIFYDDIAALADLPRRWTDESRRAGITGCSAATTTRCSAMRSGRIRGRNSCTRRHNGYGTAGVRWRMSEYNLSLVEPRSGSAL